jgi:hypothetical protein
VPINGARIVLAAEAQRSSALFRRVERPRQHPKRFKAVSGWRRWFAWRPKTAGKNFDEKICC